MQPLKLYDSIVNVRKLCSQLLIHIKSTDITKCQKNQIFYKKYMIVNMYLKFVIFQKVEFYRVFLSNFGYGFSSMKICHLYDDTN